MSVRTTKTAVRYIIDTALEDDEIDALITQANLMVTRVVGEEGLASDLLKDLETWLTAHLIAIGKERQTLSEKVGDIWLTFNKLGGKGFLEQTTFGMTVLFMDTSGNFQKSSLKRASIHSVKQNTDTWTATDY
jgi:hypothetical protein